MIIFMVILEFYEAFYKYFSKCGYKINRKLNVLWVELMNAHRNVFVSDWSIIYFSLSFKLSLYELESSWKLISFLNFILNIKLYEK